MTPAELLALGRRFFDAIEAGDLDAIRELYAPEAVIWHNHNRLETNREANLAILAKLIARSIERAYLDRRLLVTPRGFVQQHLLRCVRRSDGYVLELPACVVVEASRHRIERLNEYFDTGPLAAWFALD